MLTTPFPLAQRYRRQGISANACKKFSGISCPDLESRRGQEMIRLIETYGGKPLHAPAMREVPPSSNLEALKFADALFETVQRTCFLDA